MPYLVSSLPSILVAVALIVLGVVFGPKAGPARGRMWAGLLLLAALQVVSLTTTLLVPALVRGGVSMSMYGAVYGMIGVFTSVLMVVAVGLLVSAVVLGRGVGPGSGYAVDPTRPGAPPTAYGPGGGADGGSSPYLRP